MSMLECFFSKKYANRADLFEGLSIWQDETYRKLQGAYPVIFLSFAAVKAGNLEDAKTQIKQEIARLYEENRYLLGKNVLSENEQEMYNSTTIRMDDTTAQNALKTLSVWSLLLASGYLKVKQVDYRGITREPWYTLDITNVETLSMFTTMFRDWF